MSRACKVGDVIPGTLSDPLQTAHLNHSAEGCCLHPADPTPGKSGSEMGPVLQSVQLRQVRGISLLSPFNRWL